MLLCHSGCRFSFSVVSIDIWTLGAQRRCFSRSHSHALSLVSWLLRSVLLIISPFFASITAALAASSFSSWRIPSFHIEFTFYTFAPQNIHKTFTLLVYFAHSCAVVACMPLFLYIQSVDFWTATAPDYCGRQASVRCQRILRNQREFIKRRSV